MLPRSAQDDKDWFSALALGIARGEWKVTRLSLFAAGNTCF
jgi:hypothetical protein